MKSWVTAGVAAAVLLVVGLPALAAALGPGTSDPAGAPSFSTGRTADDGPADDDGAGTPDKAGKSQKADRDEAHDARGHRQGPPPWAHGHGVKKPGKAALEAWKKLTPAGKAKRMATLSQRHADGMKRWAACVAAGRTDCERPLPPGLAKRGLG